MTRVSRAFKSRDLSGEGINSGSHTYFLTTQGYGGPPRVREQLNTTPRQHEHYRRHRSFTQTFIPTRRVWDRWLWWPNDIRGTRGLKLPDNSFTDTEKLRKTSPRKLIPTGDRTQARCVTEAHATACSTAVDYYSINSRTTYPLY